MTQAVDLHWQEKGQTREARVDCGLRAFRCALAKSADGSCWSTRRGSTQSSTEVAGPSRNSRRQSGGMNWSYCSCRSYASAFPAALGGSHLPLLAKPRCLD